MPIEHRNLEPGTVLTARYKKEDRTCELVQTDDGLRYKLDNGELFTSPSSAGKAAMAGVACNGWRFWTVQGTEKPTAEPKPSKGQSARDRELYGELAPKREAKARAEKPAKAPAKKKTAKKPTAKKSPAKRMRAKDVASYGCGGCGATFGSQKAAVAHAMTHTS